VSSGPIDADVLDRPIRLQPGGAALDSDPGAAHRITLVDELIPIGRFAALTSLSTKALRIYHDNGLLVPAAVNPESGYRSYAVAQISVASRISLLRRAGIGLTGIAAYLADPDTSRIERWRHQLEAEVSERRQLLEHIAHLTNQAKEPRPMSSSTTSTLERAIPVLASLDLEATQRFYAERLGFEPLFTYPDYAISARDGIQIHFWLTDDRRDPENTSCRIEVTGIDALYEEMTAAGVVHPNGPLTSQPWGTREFAVLDADGNLIKFSERTGS
jgi:DNA-binding transcriptional MerR regulator